MQQVRRDLVQQKRIPEELQQQKVQVPLLEQGKGALEWGLKRLTPPPNRDKSDILRGLLGRVKGCYKVFR